MSKQWPQGAEVGEILRDNDEIGLYKPDDTPSVIDGSLNKKKTLLNFIKEIFLRGLYLNASRIAMQELTTSISGTGWWTIAQIEDGSIGGSSGIISVVTQGGNGLSCEYGIRTASSERTHTNTTIKLKRPFDLNDTFDVAGFRWAKSDTVDDGGAKLQVNSLAGSQITVLLSQNIDRLETLEGLKLIPATQTDIGLIPDGSAATFLEAGAEFEFDTAGATLFYSNIICTAISTDTIRCTMQWPEIPKQGTSVNITLPSGSIIIFDPATPTFSLALGAHSIINFGINNKTVTFHIVQAGIVNGMDLNQPLFFSVGGAGGKITII